MNLKRKSIWYLMDSRLLLWRWLSSGRVWYLMLVLFKASTARMPFCRCCQSCPALVDVWLTTFSPVHSQPCQAQCFSEQIPSFHLDFLRLGNNSSLYPPGCSPLHDVTTEWLWNLLRRSVVRLSQFPHELSESICEFWN